MVGYQALVMAFLRERWGEVKEADSSFFLMIPARWRCRCLRRRGPVLLLVLRSVYTGHR